MAAALTPITATDSGAFQMNTAKAEVDRFTKLLMRTKTIASHESSVDTPSTGAGEQGPTKGHLQKVLTTFDLVSLGVGSCCGTGMYVVAGFVARNVAGPAVIISFIIAAFASILSGVCYGEFGVRVPKTTGSAYMYSYVTVGEFIAFLIGWNMILEYVIGSAAGASAISVCFDALTNHTMSAYLEEHVGVVIGKTYPDFLGCTVGLVMTAILAVGVKGSVLFNNVLNAINFIVWLFIMVAGLFYVRPDYWSLYGFAPNGASGIFTGAATCFYAFIGFDIIGTTGEEAKNPSRSIPIAIVTSLIICLASYVSVSVVLTLMVPYYEVEGGSALVDMFVQRGFADAKYVVAIGAIAALVVSLLGSMFPMPRIIYAMARDGLLFEFLGNINRRTGTPLIATILTGVFASFMSLMISLKILIELMSIGTLLSYTLVSVSVLILRYQPERHELPVPMAHRLDPEPISTDNSSTGYNDDDLLYDPQLTKRTFKDDQYLIPCAGEQRWYGASPSGGTQSAVVSKAARSAKIWWLRLGFPSDDVRPNSRTAQTVILFTGLLFVAELATCLMVVFGESQLASGSAWAVLLLLAFIAACLACIVIILRQPQNKEVIDFQAPAVPFLPAVAMFVNIYLALNLPAVTWVRLGGWIAVGLLLYFGYSMMHSVKGKKVTKDGDMRKQQTDLENHFPVPNSSATASSPTEPPLQPPRRPPPPRQESLSKLTNQPVGYQTQPSNDLPHSGFRVRSGVREELPGVSDSCSVKTNYRGGTHPTQDSSREADCNRFCEEDSGKLGYQFGLSGTAASTGNTVGRASVEELSAAAPSRDRQVPQNIYARPRPRPSASFVGGGQMKSREQH